MVSMYDVWWCKKVVKKIIARYAGISVRMIIDLLVYTIRQLSVDFVRAISLKLYITLSAWQVSDSDVVLILLLLLLLRPLFPRCHVIIFDLR